jgi:hypothetical protein
LRIQQKLDEDEDAAANRVRISPFATGLCRMQLMDRRAISSFNTVLKNTYRAASQGAWQFGKRSLLDERRAITRAT